MRNFILFVIILFILAAILRVDFFFTVVYLFVGVYVLSRLWAGRTMAHLRVVRQFNGRAFLGDTVKVTLVIKNGGVLPVPWLMVNESLPAALATPPFYRRAISLGSKEEQRYSYEVQCRRRGYYPIGPLRIEGGDLLGVDRAQNFRIEPDYLIVYPKVLPLQRLNLPAHSPQVILPTAVPLFEDPARIIGVRDYVRGDSPRRIHWTATASAGRLLVKQYQKAIARESGLFLNLNKGDFPRDSRYVAPELAIVVAASLANHIINHENLPVGLSTDAFDPQTGALADFRLPPRKGRGQLMAILETLARVQVAEAPPFLEMVRRQAVHLSWGATVVIITGQESSGLFETVLLLSRTGFRVVLVLVQARPTEPAWRQRVEQLGVAVHQVWTEGDIKVWGEL